MPIITGMPTLHTDIVSKGWVEFIPVTIRPYVYMMRLDRPIGTWLLLLPAWWSILLAGGEWPIMILFAIGAIIMRGAGCVINDLWDRDLDKKVERTKLRPLASGQVSIRQALFFLTVLLTFGLIILVQFNTMTILLGFISLLFVIIYPLMKRFTWWPQAFLGLTFNFGALMGWSAVTGTLSTQAWLLYAAGFFWTLGYDTIYALQDKEDDAMIGIKSTARLFGDRVKLWVILFYCLAIALIIAAFLMTIDPSFIMFLLAIPALQLGWQVKTLSLSDPMNALIRFKSNRYFGLMICVVILILS